MREIRPGVRRLFQWLGRSRATAYRDADEELDALIDGQVDHFVSLGMTPEAARAEALRRLGISYDEARRQLRSSVEHRERRMHLDDLVDSLSHDIRYTLRGLRLKPAFTVGVVLTLGLGIGANAAMFGIVDRMLFRPPPLLRYPDRVHRVYFAQMIRGKENFGGVGVYARYRDLSTATTKFEANAGYTEDEITVGVGDEAREQRVASVSASFFEFFDAPPLVGRYFTAREDSEPRGASVAVLSYASWQVAFGGRQDAVGSKVQIGPELYTIIGVAPRGFVGLWPSQPPTYFIPLASRGASDAAAVGVSDWWTTYRYRWMSMLVRRRPGVTRAAADADLSSAARQSYAKQILKSPRITPAGIAKPRAIAGSILSERGPNESNFAKVATWVAGVAIIVLLVACANVANLFLTRAIRRRREIAVRVALGVSRGRLLSQLLTESVLLALAGGAAALLIAQWGGALLRAKLMPNSSTASAITDVRTLVFTALAAVAVGLLTGLAPAWQAWSANVTRDLKAGVREGSYHRSPTRVALLLVQSAMSVMMLVGAGLFVRSLSNVHSLRLGYDVDNVALVNLNMRGMKLDSAVGVSLRESLVSRAAAIPGVERAALTLTTPFWSSWSVELWVEGIDSVSKLGQFNLNAVTPDYFATVGTRIVRGRGFTTGDVTSAPRIMIVSQAMANALWPGRDALGQCVKVDADTMPCTTVVGIAENIRSQSLSDDPAYFYYLPFTQFRPQQGNLYVRVHGAASSFVDELRRDLQREMPGASYVTVTPLTDVVGSQMTSWRLGATMFTAFGVLALLIAAIGLYSVIAYNVAQRNHEVGVRVALGAQAADVIGMVVSEGVTLGVVGVAIGTAAAVAAGRWLAPLLYHESPHDPAIFAIVTVTLLGVALAASWLPARRAARVDPSVALRSE